MNCLMYVTIATPEKLILAHYGPIKDKRPDMNHFKQSDWKVEISEVLETDSVQYYVYVDSAFIVLLHISVPFGTVGPIL